MANGEDPRTFLLRKLDKQRGQNGNLLFPPAGGNLNLTIASRLQCWYKLVVIATRQTVHNNLLTESEGCIVLISGEQIQLFAKVEANSEPLKNHGTLRQPSSIIVL